MGFWDYILDEEPEQPPAIRDMIAYHNNLLRNLITKISELEEEVKAQKEKIQELESVVEFLISD